MGPLSPMSDPADGFTAEEAQYHDYWDRMQLAYSYTGWTRTRAVPTRMPSSAWPGGAPMRQSGSRGTRPITRPIMRPNRDRARPTVGSEPIDARVGSVDTDAVVIDIGIG
jgi:hypothetical protein